MSAALGYLPYHSDAQDGTVAAADVLARFSRLLASDPVDLSRVANELRSQTGLEDLVVRLGASLVLPAAPPTTLEEAVVILGTERLWILINVWSSPERKSPAGTGLLDGSANANIDGATWLNSVEARCIADFLRSARSTGQETGGSSSALWNSTIGPEQAATVTDLFVRDLSSRSPAVCPAADDAKTVV